jgi:DNA polymerase III subunit delta
MYPVYLIAGEDDYLREKSIKAIKEKVLTPSQKTQNTNYKIFYAQDSKAEEITDSARSSSFFENKNLILVREADKFSEGDKDLIVKYSKNPNKKTIVVLESSDKSILKDRKFKELSFQAKIIKCPRPLPSKIPKYIRKFVSLRKKRISKEAIQLLTINLGNNLKNLNQAIEKLALYKEEKNITSNDVKELIADDVGYNVYNLSDAIGRRETDEALKIIRRLGVDRRTSLNLLAVINWHLYRIYKAKIRLNRGKSYSQISQELKIHSFFKDKFFNQVNSFSEENIKEGLKCILDADLALKTKKIKHRIILEFLVIRLCAL